MTLSIVGGFTEVPWGLLQAPRRQKQYRRQQGRWRGLAGNTLHGMDSLSQDSGEGLDEGSGRALKPADLHGQLNCLMSPPLSD